VTVPIINVGGADALIAHYQLQEAGISPADIAAAIPVAIDAVYAARDAGGTMHDAGAAAAIAVLLAVKHA
jgi:hypothetical protein